MIFVTVGTHEQQFNRLVEKIDRLKGENLINEEVIIQTGYSDYEPINCKWQKLFSCNEMDKYVSDARIVITHGGPSSFIASLQKGKVPIVVPRQGKYGEHVNDHQLHFCDVVAERMQNIIVVKDIETLADTISNYDSIVEEMSFDNISNNEKFCTEFSKWMDIVMAGNNSGKKKRGLRIAVNAVLSYEQPRGVGRYINTVLPALAEVDRDNEYFIYYGEWMEKYEFLKIDKPNFHFIPLYIKNTQIARNLFLATKLPEICRHNCMDVLWLMDTQAILRKPKGMKYLSTIHDLAEYVIPEKYSKKQAFLRRWIVKKQAKLSDLIITISKYSKNDICSRFNISDDRIRIIYHALYMKGQGTGRVTEPEPYFLFVGEVERAKNLGCLIEAFAMLPEETQKIYHIEVVGRPGNSMDTIRQRLEMLGMADKVHFNGYLGDAELEELYHKAYAFVFPTVFEGFGLPVLEAMIKGVPVISSDSSSLPEVGGDAALYFNPYKPEQLAEQLIRVIQDKELRNKMSKDSIERAETFTMERLTNQTLEAINSLKEG